MDRDRRFEAAPPAPGESATAPKGRLRRAVVNDMRRKIERALGAADAAEELARAAESVLTAAEAEKIDLDSIGLSALRATLAKYRQATSG